MSLAVCPSLNLKVRCIRLRRYSNGTFIEVFHEHVSKVQMSEERLLEFMRALVVSDRQVAPAGILRCYVNDRKVSNGVAKDRDLDIRVEYPAKAVLRRYCGHYSQALVDERVKSID